MHLLCRWLGTRLGTLCGRPVLQPAGQSTCAEQGTVYTASVAYFFWCVCPLGVCVCVIWESTAFNGRLTLVLVDGITRRVMLLCLALAMWEGYGTGQAARTLGWAAGALVLSLGARVSQGSCVTSSLIGWRLAAGCWHYQHGTPFFGACFGPWPGLTTLDLPGSGHWLFVQHGTSHLCAKSLCACWQRLSTSACCL